MKKWRTSYEDRSGEHLTVESRSALDAAKDFALLRPRGDDCTIEVTPSDAPEQTEMFRRVAGVFSPYAPPVPEPTTPTHATATATPQTYARNKDTYSYRGWLVSDSFMKRCMAVCGYAFVGQAIIAAIIYAILVGALVGCGLVFRSMTGGFSSY